MPARGECLGIVGGGAMGLAFAAVAAHADLEVVLMVRPGHSLALLERGAIRSSGALERRARVVAGARERGSVQVTEKPADLRRCRGLIFAVKAHQLESAAMAVASGWSRAGSDDFVAGMQNGVHKDDVMASCFGSDAVVGCVSVLNASRPSPGECVVSSLGLTWVGELALGVDSVRCEWLHRALQAGGIPCRVISEMASLGWTKLANAAAAFGVSALTRLSGLEMMSQPSLVAAYRSLLVEVSDVAAAYGIALGNFEELPILRRLEMGSEEMVENVVRAVRDLRRSQPAARGGLTSMAQDVIAGRRTESVEIFGDLVRRAELAGLQVPLLLFVSRLLAGLDELASGAPSS